MAGVEENEDGARFLLLEWEMWLQAAYIWRAFWVEQFTRRRRFMNTVKVVAVGLAVGLGALGAPQLSAQEYTSVMVRDIKWQDAPSIGPGAKTAVIHGDPKSSGPFVLRLKLPPKTTIGVHTHPATENVTILSGTLFFSPTDKLDKKAAKAYGPGSYFSIAQGKPMFAYTGDKEATLQLHGTGPWGIEYLDKKEGAANKK